LKYTEETAPVSVQQILPHTCRTWHFLSRTVRLYSDTPLFSDNTA